MMYSTDSNAYARVGLVVHREEDAGDDLDHQHQHRERAEEVPEVEVLRRVVLRQVRLVGWPSAGNAGRSSPGPVVSIFLSAAAIGLLAGCSRTCFRGNRGEVTPERARELHRGPRPQAFLSSPIRRRCRTGRCAGARRGWRWPGLFLKTRPGHVEGRAVAGAQEAALPVVGQRGLGARAGTCRTASSRGASRSRPPPGTRA
jgi:hypothetical protein